jgi:RNA polymerase sigma-70 factor (ECF subfamily)
MAKKKQDEFLKLYEPVHERFERFCRARAFGNADFRDLMNDTLVVAFSKFDTLKSHEAFLSFLFSICVRIVGNQIQKKREESLLDPYAVPDFQSHSQEDVDVYFLHLALSKLDEEVRECLILFEISGFKIKEIAVIQGTSDSAIKKRLTRGRDKLKMILTEKSLTPKTESHENV